MTEVNRERGEAWEANEANEHLRLLLAELPAPALDEALTLRVRQAGHAALRLRPVPRTMSVAVAMSVVSYLAWAIHFVFTLH